LPAGRFDRFQTAKRRGYRWIEQGIFDRIFEAVPDDPDMEWITIDTTVIRAPAQAVRSTSDHAQPTTVVTSAWLVIARCPFSGRPRAGSKALAGSSGDRRDYRDQQ
jgi:hypothetical protein